MCPTTLQISSPPHLPPPPLQVLDLTDPEAWAAAPLPSGPLVAVAAGELTDLMVTTHSNIDPGPPRHEVEC